MVSPLVAQAILSNEGPDVVGSFQRGREDARQGEIKRLSSQALKGEEGAFDALQGIAPEVAMMIGEKIGAGSARDLNNFVRDAGYAQKMLAGGNNQGAMVFVSNRLNDIKRRGGDTNQTQRIYDLLSTGQNDAALQELTAFTESIDGAKGVASAKTEILADGTTIQALPTGEVVVRNSAGKIVFGDDRIAAIQAAQDFKEAAQRKQADIDVEKSRKTANATNRASRASDITAEISNRNRIASRATINLNQAANLINSAQQGVGGATKLRLSKLFPGIDASDEAALSQSLTNLALDELQKFSGPTTDFEFQKTEEIAGTLGDSRAANAAKVASLQRANWFVKREAEQFRDHVKSGGDPDAFAFDFDEQIKTKKGTFSLQDIQDTALANNFTIEQTVKELNK
jgi:hypothetical protein